LRRRSVTASRSAPSQSRAAPLRVGSASVRPELNRPGRLKSPIGTRPAPDVDAVLAAIGQIRSIGDENPAVGLAGAASPQPEPNEEAEVAAVEPETIVPDSPPAAAETPTADSEPANEPTEDATQQDENSSTEDESVAEAVEEPSDLAPQSFAGVPKSRPEGFEVAAVEPTEAPAAKPETVQDAAPTQEPEAEPISESAVEAEPSAPATEDAGETEAAEELEPSALAALSSPEPSKRPRTLERIAKTTRVKPISPVLALAPTSVRRAATQTGLSLDRTSLIGVIDANSGRKALLRMPSGDFRKVSRGDVIEGWRVSAIGRDAMRLTRQGQNRTLLLVTR
ncbi:MAG: hypothetical protein AAF439_07995, partial [Pseudomonadota bacterium]